jgi:hypothetical protein
MDCDAYAYQFTGSGSNEDGAAVLAGTMSYSPATETVGQMETVTLTNGLSPFQAVYNPSDPSSDYWWGNRGVDMAVNGTIVSTSPASDADINNYSSTSSGVAAWSSTGTSLTDESTSAFASGQQFSVTFRVTRPTSPDAETAYWSPASGVQPETNNYVGWGGPSGAVSSLVSKRSIPVGSGGTPPTAGINYEPTGTVANQWTFDGSPSQPGTSGAAITNYAWNFGDGTTSPTNSSPTVTHAYASEGDETVSLTVTDADGQTGMTSTTITPALRVTNIARAPAQIDAGSVFTSSVTVTNEGTTTVTGVVPTASVADTSLATLDTTPSPTSADIPPGLSQSFTFQGQALASGSTTVNAGAAGTAAAQTVTAPTVPAALTIGNQELAVALVNPPSALTLNTATTLTVRVTALGSQGATNVNVAAPVIVDGSGPGVITTTSGPSASNLTLPTQGSSQTVTFSIEQTANGSISYTVTATGTDTATASPVDSSVTGDLAQTAIVVNETDDTALPAQELADGICDVDANTAGNQCTLRAAIQLANTLAGSQSITFDIPGGGVPLIAPASALPTLQASISIDGTTQSGGWVQLSGASEGGTAPGLTVGGGASVIRGLVIDGWAHFGGVFVSGGSGTVIAGDRLGTDPSGTTAVPNEYGVYISVSGVTVGGTDGTSSSMCTGDCNLISGNVDSGVHIEPGGSATVQGDFIGTDLTGESALGNGMGVDDEASGVSSTTLIGGPTSHTGSAPGNVISGNLVDGLRLAGIDTVQGNLIGEDASGSRSLQPSSPFAPPGQPGGSTVGIGVVGVGSSVVMVGGTAQADRNVIGGFGNIGVAQVTTVDHDEIGTNPAGTSAIANGAGTDSVTDVVDSLLSGNTGEAVYNAHLVSGDRIGTTADALAALPNGLGVTGSVQVGGVRPAGSRTCTDPCNVISGNLGPAVDSTNTVQGNFIGTDLSGTAAIPNNSNGSGSAALELVGQVGGASGAVARGVCDLACNVISGNSGYGIELNESEATVEGNLIGTDIGLFALGNTRSGVFSMTSGDAADLIGGDDDLGNVIAHNGGAAVEIGEHSALATVEGNAMIGNVSGGILIDSGFSGQVPASPTIATAVRTPGQVAITGYVTDVVTSSNQYVSRIDLYASATCTSGPQGQVPLGHVTIGPITDGSFAVTAQAPAQSLPYVVATSTESSATSPFSQCFPITTASSTTPKPGQTVTVQSPGFTPGETVSVTLHSTPVNLGTVTADASGDVDATVTIPIGTVPGAHELIFTGLSSGRVVTVPITVSPLSAGYDLVAADGGTFSLGDAAFYGSEGGTHLNSPVVGMAPTPSGRGYWLVAADGGVFSFGDAAFYGSEGGAHLNSPVVGIAATPSGDGYWLVASDGGVFSFGDAAFDGSAAGTRLSSPVVGTAATPSGNGYWLVASDGGVFSFGDATFFGSEGGTHVNSPVVGMAPAAAGRGYWLVAADGGVFAFGDAGFFGSEGGARLDAPVVGMAANADGKGYWLVGSDGGVFSFGDATFFGSEGGTKLNSPVVGLATWG